MSVDIQWETLTTGPDGARLAESIREFIHDKFQRVPLPRFIRSVRVHSFAFGTVAPEIELKDICDPLPDFYEDDEVDDADPNEESQADSACLSGQARVDNPGDPDHSSNLRSGRYPSTHDRLPNPVDTRPAGFRDVLAAEQPATPAFPSALSPGIPGGTSNLTYFHLPLGAGLSGTATPLAAVAGAHFHRDWQDNASGRGRDSPPNATQQAPVSGRQLTPPSIADPSSRPPSQHYLDSHDSSEASSTHAREERSDARIPTAPLRRMHQQDPQDIQVVAHVRYSGDLKLSLTAEILLDYPMPSFVGIPLKLNITGLTFDGVAIVAHIKKRAHFCFLSPEDADALVGRQDDLQDRAQEEVPPPVGGLLEEIRVESEIGDKDNGRQVLKNVGKVERFVLEQVRRIFEDEFVYPSFWTFLV